MQENWDVQKHRKRYITLATLIFLLVGIGHLLRIIYGWQFVIAGWTVPFYLSWLAVLVTLLMVVMGIAYLKR